MMMPMFDTDLVASEYLEPALIQKLGGEISDLNIQMENELEITANRLLGEVS